jgi:hypothetical protein
VSSGVDEVVMRASLVSIYYRQFQRVLAIAILKTVAKGIISMISFDLPALEGAKDFRRNAS